MAVGTKTKRAGKAKRNGKATPVARVNWKPSKMDRFLSDADYSWRPPFQIMDNCVMSLEPRWPGDEIADDAFELSPRDAELAKQALTLGYRISFACLLIWSAWAIATIARAVKVPFRANYDVIQKRIVIWYRMGDEVDMALADAAESSPVE